MHRIHAGAVVSPLADLEDSVRGSILEIGDGCMIDSFVKIKFTGGLGDIRIGSHSHLNSGTVLYSGNGITIGDHVLVAANCTFAPTNHAYDRRDVPIAQQRFKPSKGGIVIEDDVWIGSNCVLLDGSLIRRGAIVGANSLVRGELEAYGIYGGSPAVLIGRRPD
ncbi:MAG: acyltransferase [bacterium]|nr:acyltransferase [bacterium]